MTTRPTAATGHSRGFVRLPDPPEPEDMNNYTHLHLPGNTHHLAAHFGNHDTTIITGEAYSGTGPHSKEFIVRDLTDAEVQAMGYAVGLELDGPELTEVTHSLNAMLEMMDALEVPGVNAVEPVPLILPDMEV